MSDRAFLPGVPAARVLVALRAAAGKEIESGKFASPESSSSLAVNAFGWFIERPEMMPALPGLEDLDWPAVSVEVERCLRFPWPGGRHPWLDAVVTTDTCLIGVESKRFEPFRDKKVVKLSLAYDRPVWGEGMGPFEKLRDDLRSGACHYEFLDATQLVKHAFGLVTQARLTNKQAVLAYLFAEPSDRLGRVIPEEAFKQHRLEIADFARRVEKASVRFSSCSYREWLGQFRGAATKHADAMRSVFAP